MCATGESRSVRFFISSLGRSFGRWSCWMDESRLLARWLKSSAVLRKMFNCAKNSSIIERLSKPNLQKTPRFKTRSCWFQWCTYHGNSVKRLCTVEQGQPNRLTQPQNAAMCHNMNTFCLYVCSCTRVSLHTYIEINTFIHIPQYTYICTPMYTNTDVCMNIHIYRYVYTYVYVHMFKYIRWECCKFDRLPDRMVVCARFLIIRS